MQRSVRALSLGKPRSGFLSGYLTTMRPYLMFVSGITGIAGLSFAPDPAFHMVGLVAIASFLSYGFGQALTDCFQTDTDALSAPYRPLTRGAISKAWVLGVSAAGLILCVSVFAVFNTNNIIWGALAGFGLATYTPFKRKWWAGPFYNAWIVVVLCLMAFFATNISTIPRSFIWTLAVVFFSYTNFVLTGYFKDTEADRATGYYTFPVVFGRKAAARVSDLFALMTLGLAMLVLSQRIAATGTPTALVPPIAFAFGGLVATIIGQVVLHHVHRDDQAHEAISPVVHSYILLLASVASSNQPDWGVYLLIFYLSFNLVMKNRPAQDQI